MTTSVQLFESVNGVITEVNNVNFKNTSNDAHEYYLYPLRRPSTAHTDLTYSYVKPIFFKFQSTGQIKNYVIEISLGEAGESDSQLFYRFHNNDSATNAANHTMSYMENRTMNLFPFVSTVSPASATTRPSVLSPNVYYYTNYLKLQTRVMYKDNSAGNGDSIGIKFKFDTF